MDKIEYSFPTEELDDLIDKLNKGIVPAVPPEMLAEARLRLKERENELFDGEEPATAEEIRRHNEMMRKKIEEDKHRQTHHSDIKIRKITEKQKEDIRKSVSSSIVRMRVSSYNKTDEELYGDAERKRIVEGLQNVKSIIRNQADYQKAMQLIVEAVNYSFEHDYPGQKKSDVLEMWKNGEIKINIPIPKLFSDYVHEVTDPETKRAIASGEMTMMSKAEMDSEIVKKDYSKSALVEEEYNTITDIEFDRMVEMYNQGYDTPLNVLFKNRGKIYNQFTISTSNIFSDKYGQQENKEPFVFDWLQEDAATKYIEKVRGIDPYDMNLIIGILNEKNDNKLSREFSTRIKNGDTIRISNNEGYVTANQVDYTKVQPKDERTLELEQRIFQAIQGTN